jgi:CRISPR/Cas system CMR subunit Cmr4 (Cas7 group RAMP superfamily)
MIVANNIDVGGVGVAGGIFIDTKPVRNEPGVIQALTAPYIITKDRQLIRTLDGSVSAEIVVNAEDKEALNEDCDETKKLLNEEREEKREMYFRQARLLYPEKEEWTLSLAIDAFMYQEEKGIDITKHKFAENAEKY